MPWQYTGILVDGSRVILVMCKNCSDISWHQLNLNQSKANCPKNLNSDGLIIREMGPWPECIFRSLLQFLFITFVPREQNIKKHAAIKQYILTGQNKYGTTECIDIYIYTNMDDYRNPNWSGAWIAYETCTPIHERIGSFHLIWWLKHTSHLEGSYMLW